MLDRSGPVKPGLVRVVVADDSAYVRKVITSILSVSPFIEVAGTARNGQEALRMVEELDPDVVVTDLVMPEMNGAELIRRIMRERPRPVLVCTQLESTTDLGTAALEAGAVEFLRKPTALASKELYQMREALIERVKALGQSSRERIGRLLSEKPLQRPVAPKIAPPRHKRGTIEALAVGASTGGPQALRKLFSKLPENFPLPIAVVLHMPVGFTDWYAEGLDKATPLRVKEAADGDLMTPGVILVAKAGFHLKLRRTPQGLAAAQLDSEPADTLHKPSVDVLFASAAEVYGPNVLGVVLTGMGSDGKAGAEQIKRRGGLVFTESKESCVVYGMPKSVKEAGLSDLSAPLDDLPRAILETI